MRVSDIIKIVSGPEEEFQGELPEDLYQSFKSLPKEQMEAAFKMVIDETKRQVIKRLLEVIGTEGEEADVVVTPVFAGRTTTNEVENAQ